jgi:lysophospholipase L1-like esterase
MRPAGWFAAAAPVVVAVLLIGCALWFAAARGAIFAPPGPPPGDRPPAGAEGPLKPGMPLLVLLAGTSGVAKGSWSAELEAELAACRPAGVRVERLAKAGANSRWGEPALAARLAAGPTPDIVVIEFAGNDARLYRGMTTAESEARHRRMVAAVRQAGAVPFLSTMAAVIGREQLERPGLDAYRGAFRRIARDNGAGLIDTEPAWKALPPAQLARWLPDGSHFTAEAARAILIPRTARALAPLVCDPV